MATVELTRERTPAPAPAPQHPPLVEMIRAGWTEPRNRPLALGAVGALVLMGLIFRDNLKHFIHVWWNDENYSHGFLVPFISLYFANEAARRGPVAIRSGVVVGSLMMAFALMIKLVTIVIPFSVASDYGLLIGLAGLCAVLVGSEALRRFWFGFFFLVFLVPLPVALYSMIANPLQLWVSFLATAMLNLVGVPSLCDGNMITLAGDSQLFVAEACSGMRQLTGFLALTTAWAYLSARPLWYRMLLIASSIPIAMMANVVRVTLTGIITYKLDAKYASGMFHTFEGLAMMAFALFMLATFAFTLDQVIEFVKKISKRFRPQTPSMAAGASPAGEWPRA